MEYRVYVSGDVVHEDDFTNADNSQMHCDEEYKVVTVPNAVVSHIENEVELPESLKVQAM